MRHGPLTVIAYCPLRSPFSLWSPTLLRGLRSLREVAASRVAKVEIEQRVIWGTGEAILEIIQGERGTTLSMSYVESRNGNYRKDNKRLSRRSTCYSKHVAFHDAHIDLLTGIYNFVDENVAFRQCLNPEAKRFEVKYKKFSPAMLEGLTDRCLTLEELLMRRVPRQ